MAKHAHYTEEEYQEKIINEFESGMIKLDTAESDCRHALNSLEEVRHWYKYNGKVKDK